MEKNPDGNLLKLPVGLFLYLETNQVLFRGKCLKRIRKAGNLNFRFHS